MEGDGVAERVGQRHLLGEEDGGAGGHARVDAQRVRLERDAEVLAVRLQEAVAQLAHLAHAAQLDLHRVP